MWLINTENTATTATKKHIFPYHVGKCRHVEMGQDHFTPYNDHHHLDIPTMGHIAKLHNLHLVLSGCVWALSMLCDFPTFRRYKKCLSQRRWSLTKNQINYQIIPQHMLKELLNLLDWFIEVQLTRYLSGLLLRSTPQHWWQFKKTNSKAPFTIYRQISRLENLLSTAVVNYLCMLLEGAFPILLYELHEFCFLPESYNPQYSQMYSFNPGVITRS